jgi:thiamine biosynthesis lipoprotein
MEFDEFSAMNTLIQSAAEGEPERLQAGFERVRQFFAASEARFSRFRQDSELNRLNRAAGSWFQASPELFEVVQDALDLHHLTGGLFDPSILNALQRAGYDRSMDEIKKLPGLEAVSPVTWERPQFAQTRLDPGRSAIRLPEGVPIDLGGIAKGWTASKAADLLSAYSPACTVNAGGDMACVGLPQGQPAWQIDLEDPRDEQQVLAVLQIAPGALATTTITRRRWLQGGQSRHHVIDPRSGQPVESSWLSVSVYAPKATHAEAFAKALLMLGEDEILAFMGQFPQYRFLAVDCDGRLWGTPQSKEIIDVPEHVQ